MVWPMCEGRDVSVSIKEEELAIQIKPSPLTYDYISSSIFLSYTLVKMHNNILLKLIAKKELWQKD
jgi:hypothetical protein